MEANDRDFRPTASLDALRQRADLLRRVRRFFEECNFLEVETPLLSSDTVVDRHLDPIPVSLFSDPRQMDLGRRMWLQTSPELAMKRLLCAGAPSIYQITKSFRGGESGRLHNPEFTIIEWYGVGHDMHQGMQLLSDLAEVLLERGAADRLSYREAFQRSVGIDPHPADGRQLSIVADRLGVRAPASLTLEDRDGWLDLLLVERVEPHLGADRPMILYDYPASQAALARIRSGIHPVAERFELYFRGIELANGYHELCDAGQLRARNRRTNELRIADGKVPLPLESRLLTAMDSGLPPCTGVALGFDRVAMLVSGAKNLSQVLAFSVDFA